MDTKRQRKCVNKIKSFVHCVKHCSWINQADISDADIVFDAAVEIETFFNNLTTEDLCTALNKHSENLNLKKASCLVLEMFLSQPTANNDMILHIINRFLRHNSKNQFEDVLKNMFLRQTLSQHLINFNVSLCTAKDSVSDAQALSQLLSELSDEDQFQNIIEKLMSKDPLLLMLVLKESNNLGFQCKLILKNTLEYLKRTKDFKKWNSVLSKDGCSIYEVCDVTEELKKIIHLFLNEYSQNVVNDFDEFNCKWSNSEMEVEEFVQILSNMKKYNGNLNDVVESYIASKLSDLGEETLFWSDIAACVNSR